MGKRINRNRTSESRKKVSFKRKDEISLLNQLSLLKIKCNTKRRKLLIKTKNSPTNLIWH